MKFSWKKDASPEALIKKLKSIRSLKDGTVSFSGFEYQEYVATLSSMFAAPEEMTGDIWSNIVTSGISASFKEEEVTRESVLREVNRILGTYRAKRELQFNLITTLNVRFPADSKSIRIGDEDIRFCATLPRKYVKGRSEALSHTKSWLANSDDSRGAYVIVRVKARGENEAAEKALFSLDLLRAFWNYQLNKSSVIRYGGRRKEINQVMLGTLHTLHEQSGGLATQTYWYEQHQKVSGQYIWKKSDLEKIYKSTAFFKRKLLRSNFKKFLETAFVRFVRSLDTDDYYASFTKMWGLLEHLTGTLNEKYEKTVKRTAFLFDDNEYHIAVLNQLKNARNNYVHLATESPEMDMQVYQLHGYVRHIIRFVLINYYKFDTLNDLHAFMDMPVDRQEVKKRIDTLRKVARFLS